MKKIFILLLTMIFVSAGYTQFPEPGKFEDDSRMHERIRTIKILKMTEELQLTEEQSIVFFPRYNSLEKELINLDEELKILTMKIVESVESGANEKTKRELMTQIDNLDKKKFEKHQEIIHSFDDILTLDQQALLLTFEYRFPMMMRDIMREMRGESRKYKNGKGWQHREPPRNDE